MVYIFEKVSFDPYHFRITSQGSQLGNSDRWNIFKGYKYAYIYFLNTKYA